MPTVERKSERVGVFVPVATRQRLAVVKAERGFRSYGALIDRALDALGEARV